MSNNEQHIKLAAQMYEVRDTARRIAGDGYAARIEDWKRSLSRIAEKLGVGPFRAVLTICATRPVTEFDIMWLTAAAVELAEPEVRP